MYLLAVQGTTDPNLHRRCSNTVLSLSLLGNFFADVGRDCGQEEKGTTEDEMLDGITDLMHMSAARGISPDEGWNPHLLHWQEDSLPLGPQGSPDLESLRW